LKSRLLDGDLRPDGTPGDLNACHNGRGRYSPTQFVLRLSSDVHRHLAALPVGIFRGNLDSDTLQAFSTYLHETVHWWQHIGSTAGFIRSMSYTAQSHANFKYLRRLLEAIGPKKSIRELAVRLADSGSPETPGGLANVIVNNHFDMPSFPYSLAQGLA
jgi:hypothetical protein